MTRNCRELQPAFETYKLIDNRAGFGKKSKAPVN